MGQESSRVLKRLAQGVQKVPKGVQKVPKSHEKDIQKASTRQANANMQLPSAFPPPCLGLRLPFAVAIALAIALLIELPIEFPMHLLIAFGCLVEAFWMSFSCLFDTFWKPFGTFWTPWASLFRPRDDSWPIWGAGCKKLRKSYNLVELWLAPGSPNWDNFGNFDDFVAVCFVVVFWVRNFLTICSFGIHLESNLWC